ncbi:MAG: hypothetical protein H6544_05960 [Prevotellaceae bacterium]|nr:hypothetical protein [Prevotellaceae bacterium]
MAKGKKESFFWTSYSDLMTSLFFVMLMLFVLTIALLHKKMVDIEKERKATEEQLEKVKEIEEATNKIDPTYFEYSPKYKKHILKIKVRFPVGSSNIDNVDVNTLQGLLQAGNIISRFIADITNKYPVVKYLLVIEGQASRDGYNKNYELSYDRALALQRFWQSNGIDFGKNCEVLISGSGIGGTMREKNESLNQRFLIHIIPKPGVIEASKK